MANPGYVPLRRGILSHLHGMTGNEVKVYIALLCLADHRTGKVKVTTRDLADGLDLNRSSISDALRRLAEPHNDSGTRYIGYKPGKNQYEATTITILKYLKDSSAARALHNRCQDECAANVQHAPSDLRKRAPKNLRSKEQPTAQEKGFDEFWEAYPKKRDKGRARKDFEKALRLTDIDTILAAVERYKKSDEVKRGFIKYPSTWLNAEAWDDDYAERAKEVEW